MKKLTKDRYQKVLDSEGIDGLYEQIKADLVAGDDEYILKSKARSMADESYDDGWHDGWDHALQ